MEKRPAPLDLRQNRQPPPVTIPAAPGIPAYPKLRKGRVWIPAFAGMTGGWRRKALSQRERVG